MPNEAERLASIPIHKDATDFIKERSRWFATNLTVQAKLNADTGGHNLVTLKHAEDALEATLRKPQRKGRVRRCIAPFGGVLLGLGIMNISTELRRSADVRPFYMLLFIGLFALGIIIILVEGLVDGRA